MVRNEHLLNKFLVFKPNSFYKFVLLLREKDGETLLKNYEKKEILVKQWLVDNQEYLEKVLPDMLTLTKLLKGRLYVTTDRKNITKTLFEMQNKVMENLKQLTFNNEVELSVKALNKILASSTSVKEVSDGDKRWLFDVDTKDAETLKKVEELCGQFHLVTLQTKNGFHVLAERKFDARNCLNNANLENVEVKDNALALVDCFV